ncbi:MAG TPA: hypothetical protein VFQ82_07785 [Stellaceae bacterium]|jgi:hypothetical protein|nr:hypothetical protein [Stellaceae bacterium]
MPKSKLVCRLAAGGLCLAMAGAGPARQTGVLHLRCTNPASGTNWPLVVDLARGRVDAFPAEVSERAISWHEPERGFFELDRATGKLELRNASSTGGYFLHYTCRPE